MEKNEFNTTFKIINEFLIHNFNEEDRENIYSFIKESCNFTNLSLFKRDTGDIMGSKVISANVKDLNETITITEGDSYYSLAVEQSYNLFTYKIILTINNNELSLEKEVIDNKNNNRTVTSFIYKDNILNDLTVLEFNNDK